MHTMLLGQIDRKFVDNLASVAGQCAKERPITVHHNEAKLGV